MKREIKNPDGSMSIVEVDDFGTPTSVEEVPAPEAPEDFSTMRPVFNDGPSVEELRQLPEDAIERRFGPEVHTGVESTLTGVVGDEAMNMHLSHADSPSVEQLQEDNPQDRAGIGQDGVEGPTGTVPDADSEAVQDPTSPSANDNILVPTSAATDTTDSTDDDDTDDSDETEVVEAPAVVVEPADAPEPVVEPVAPTDPVATDLPNLDEGDKPAEG